MPVAAVFHKGGLKRWFDPRYLREVNVSGELTPAFGFEVEFLDLVSIGHHDTRLLGVGGIDEHFL